LNHQIGNDLIALMNQHEAVIEVMRRNGGYATLGQLYREALQVPGVKWGTKTPFSSINRIVQNKRYFFRIRPGLWALLDAKDKLATDIAAKPKPESDHTYYQGLLIELGNLRKLKTFVPMQDRNRRFLGRPLGEMVTVGDIFPFTYPEIVKRASTVDVIWFDERNLPAEFIEVENTTDINGALLKFTNFDAFHAQFRIVAPSVRHSEFKSKLSQLVFKGIRDRTRFSTYDLVSSLHGKANELVALEENWS